LLRAFSTTPNASDPRSLEGEDPIALPQTAAG
jgi:hypothetical protein